MELANKEDVCAVITTGDESVNKVGKVATPRRPQGESVLKLFSLGSEAYTVLCQTAGAWCKAAQCNPECDAHSTRYVEDVPQSDTADYEMCGLGLYTLTRFYT